MAQTFSNLNTDDVVASILIRLPAAEHTKIERLWDDSDALLSYLAKTNDITLEEARDTLELSQIVHRIEDERGALKAA